MKQSFGQSTLRDIKLPELETPYLHLGKLIDDIVERLEEAAFKTPLIALKPLRPEAQARTLVYETARTILFHSKPSKENSGTLLFQHGDIVENELLKRIKASFDFTNDDIMQKQLAQLQKNADQEHKAMKAAFNFDPADVSIELQRTPEEKKRIQNIVKASLKKTYEELKEEVTENDDTITPFVTKQSTYQPSSEEPEKLIITKEQALKGFQDGLEQIEIFLTQIKRKPIQVQDMSDLLDYMCDAPDEPEKNDEPTPP